MYLKKSLGQHFLHDQAVLAQITQAIGDLTPYQAVVEIGPGMGALTKYLMQTNPLNLHLIELDDRWAQYLREQYPMLGSKLIHGDILHIDWTAFIEYPTHIVGNFPYNISSQIVFAVIDHRDRVQTMTGMFQKEMAKRIASPAGSKEYGVISVLTQAYYDAEYLFDIPPTAFDPPPQVMSGMIRLTRRQTALDCDERLFKRIVKQAFTQRRKTLRNSLKSIMPDLSVNTMPIFDSRPEQLTVADFESLTRLFTPNL